MERLHALSPCTVSRAYEPTTITGHPLDHVRPRQKVQIVRRVTRMVSVCTDADPSGSPLPLAANAFATKHALHKLDNNRPQRARKLSRRSLSMLLPLLGSLPANRSALRELLSSQLNLVPGARQGQRLRLVSALCDSRRGQDDENLLERARHACVDPGGEACALQAKPLERGRR